MTENDGTAGTDHQDDICKRTFEFALRMVRLCQALSEKPVGRALGRQLLRSGTSIGANVEEAQGGQSRKDFIHKMSIARKEAYESHYWLRLVLQAGLMPEDRMSDIIDECHQIRRIISAIIISAERNT